MSPMKLLSLREFLFKRIRQKSLVKWLGYYKDAVVADIDGARFAKIP